MRNRASVFIALLAMLLAACGSSGDGEVVATDAAESSAEATAAPVATTAPASDDASAETASTDEAATEATAVVVEADTDEAESDDADTEETAASGSSYGGSAAADSTEDESTEVVAGPVESFSIDVWADNWMAVYVDGVLIGEDSVSINTERSFNSETFTFEASYPFTLAIEAKDYRETDSGLEYIGESNQQMGDGGIIAQVKDSSGAVVAVTDGDWTALVVHRAPLNTDCASDSDPNSTCEFEISETPSNWTAVDFDDSAWSVATIWPSADVDPKIGYDDISWDSSAQFLWGTDLLVDNTVLLRSVVAG